MKTPRGHELVLTDHGGGPTLTVELYVKWYTLWLVKGHEVTEVEFPDMGNYEKLGSPYLDHAPNPRHVCAWAEKNGFEIDHLALELMVGRWELEGTSHYEDMERGA